MSIFWSEEVKKYTDRKTLTWIAPSKIDWEQGHVDANTNKTYEENKIESNTRIRTKETYMVFGNIEIDISPGYQIALKVCDVETKLFKETIVWIQQKTVLNFSEVVEIGVQIAKTNNTVVSVNDFDASGVKVVALYTLADVFRELYTDFIATEIELRELAYKPTYAEMLLGGAATKLIAHRGQMGVAPENSMPAYVAAIEAGYPIIEVDPKRTSDGVWIMMHDVTVDRTTDGTGHVDAMTYAQIQALNIDIGPNIEKYPNLKIPAVYDTLVLCKKNNVVPLLHRDAFGYMSELVDMVKGLGMERNVIVQSYYFSRARELRNLSKKIPIMMIGDQTMDEVATKALIDSTAELDNIIGINFTNLSVITQDIVEYAHRKNVPVCVFNINDQSVAENYINMGVDMIITDILI